LFSLTIIRAEAELTGAHKSSENRGLSIVSLCLSITYSAPSAAPLSSITSRYWRRTRWTVQIDSTNALCIYNVQTMMFLAFAGQSGLGHGLGLAPLETKTKHTRSRPRPRSKLL